MTPPPTAHTEVDRTRYGRTRPDVNRYLKWAFAEAANSVAVNPRRCPERHVSRLYQHLREPTKPMLTEAAAGFYEPSEPAEKFIKVRRASSARYPRIQILTIAELLGGKKLAYPSGPVGPDKTFAKAERKPKSQQAGLF